MEILNDWSDNGVWYLFGAFFLLYGLEFFFPLVRRKSRHWFSNLASALILSTINLSFTSLTLLIAALSDRYHVGLFHNAPIPVVPMVIVSIVFLDFWAGYLVHVLHHRYSWLWRLHSVHHSDDLVDVTTTFRQHPGESVIRIGFHLSGLVILGIPLWILLVYLTLSSIHAQLEHANIRLPAKVDRMLQLVIVTPNMHKVHHSRYQHETDSNYSNIFSVWDRMFRTFRKRDDYDAIEYGLDYLEYGKHYNYIDLIRLPFQRHPGASKPVNSLVAKAKKSQPGLKDCQ